MSHMTSHKKTKILHVIGGLTLGGAQAVMTRLIENTLSDAEHTVVSMLDEGVYGKPLRRKGVCVVTLNMQPDQITKIPVLAMRSILRSAQPDIVQTWMYHADLLGGVVARLSRCNRVIWGIRHSDLDPARSKARTRRIARLCAFLSRWIPSAIACCSNEAARVHQSLGYRSDKFRIIHNGYDLESFRPDAGVRSRIRSEWHISENELLLGLVGRWNAQKDHANLLQAMSRVASRGLAFRCVLVGPDMARTNPEVVELLRRHAGLQDRIMLMGPRFDIPAVMNALDIHILSSSFGEACPNVVAESMACGTPCVATDVGDAALIVGNPSWVAPPRDPAALATAIERAAGDLDRDGRDAVGSRCRDRIAANFSLARMVDAYRALWSEVAEKLP